MARPERRYGQASGITLGGIIVIVGIVLILVWSFWIGLIIASHFRQARARHGLTLALTGPGVPFFGSLSRIAGRVDGLTD